MPEIGNEHRQRCCPSCREPLNYPSGDGCAAMTKHISDDRQRPAVVALEHVEELEDGGAIYKFHMDEASKDKILEEGLKLIIACAVSKVDLADVYAWIEEQEKTDV